MKRQGSFFRPVYKFSVFFSILFHLIFVTTLEAAIYFGKILNAPQQAPIFLNFISEEAASRNQSAHVIARSPARAMSEAGRSVELEKQSRPGIASPPQRSAVALTKKSLEHFTESQTTLDKRIRKLKQDLEMLSADERSNISAEFILPKVLDIEKIPLEIRKDLLPLYLKKIRLKIADRWLELVEKSNLDSGLATINYRVGSDGTVSSLTTRVQKGTEWFGELCSLAVIQAGPFEPLPFHFQDTEAKRFLTIALTFHLKRVKRVT